MKKSLLALVLSIMLLATASSALALVDFSNYAAQSSFTLMDAADLAAFRDYVNAGNDFAGKTVTLGSSITISGEWTPIGNGTRSGKTYTGNAFKGTFDGKGNSISGLTMTGTTVNEDHALGLFGVVDGGTVKNVTLNVNYSVSNSECIGGVVGLLVNHGAVSGVTVNGSMSAARGIGGVVGRMLVSGSITSSTNNASITGTSAGGNVGGIVGAAYYTESGSSMTINGCANTGNVNGKTGVGGIAGLSAADVSSCTNSGMVTGEGTSVGGIVGEQKMAGSVNGNTNTASVANNGGGYGTGGIVGWVRYNDTSANYGMRETIEVSNNSNSGSVTGGSDAGGIVGTVYYQATVQNNTNTAGVLSGTNFAAGIVGNYQAADSNQHADFMTKKLTVTDNTSTTELTSISANCKDLFVYDNTQGAAGVTIANNSTELPAAAAVAAVDGGVPSTGDSTPIFLLACLLLLSGCALVMGKKRFA